MGEKSRTTQKILFSNMPTKTPVGETFGNTSPCALGTGQGRDTTENLPKALCGTLPDLVLHHQRKESSIVEASVQPAKRYKVGGGK